jgi:hypothetical protein
MANRPRRIKANSTYCEVQRTVDREKVPEIPT